MSRLSTAQLMESQRTHPDIKFYNIAFLFLANSLLTSSPCEDFAILTSDDLLHVVLPSENIFLLNLIRHHFFCKFFDPEMA